MIGTAQDLREYIPTTDETTTKIQHGHNPLAIDDKGNIRDFEDDETEKILADELFKLSFRERTKVHEEIHGVRDAYEGVESAAALDKALGKLEDELASGKASEAAKKLNIPRNRAFKLAFLRCDSFDAAKAAHRLVTYVRLVRSLSANNGHEDCLGGERGGRIRASVWFTKDEYAALKKGSIQLAPYRDRTGRRILIVWSACFRLPMVTRMKIILYLISGASEDVESQKKGFVILVWPGSCPSIKPSDEGFLATLMNRKVASDVQMAIPLRVVCLHFGYESGSPLLRFARALLVGIAREKQRIHVLTGSLTELGYEIMGFGIHPGMLPVGNNGVIKNQNHLRWIEGGERIDREPYGSPLLGSSGKPAVDCPGFRDVLFQRGKACQYHPGNASFRGILEAQKSRHKEAHQSRKREIGWEIVETVEASGGRFLKWDPGSGWWVGFTDRTEVRHKVATSLRDFDKHFLRRQQKQTPEKPSSSRSSYLFVDRSERRKRRRTSRDEDYDSSDCSCGGFVPLM